MVSVPELKKYLDKRVVIQLNGTRKVAGVVRGYDMFLNITLDDAIEMPSGSGSQSDKNAPAPVPMGSQTVIRGNSILSIEALDTVV
ncbi:mRNA splicing protein [Maudiozyma humilis]|uniref:Small nuclear ribonucleoprotein G n=1 Tax=Maudiozyma humilis TaxID=51915 RepID=A0AAV5RQS3_MAUHU|nr:hypothetical protein DAKH74_005550 [Kazachstania humilis]GMM57703.1 mRNA splicing protein [Kazachstania humilis]